MLAHALADSLHSNGILLPTVDVMERICAEAIARANKYIHAALSAPLTRVHRQCLDELLTHKEGAKTTKLAWLRLSPKKPNSRHMQEHINLTGDYVWRSSAKVDAGKFRPLRPLPGTPPA